MIFSGRRKTKRNPEMGLGRPVIRKSRTFRAVLN